MVIVLCSIRNSDILEAKGHSNLNFPAEMMVKSDIGKPIQKKEALTLEQQKRFVKG